MNMEASEVQLDLSRSERVGFAEAVFCLQKTVNQIEVILTEYKKHGGPVLLTQSFHFYVVNFCCIQNFYFCFRVPEQ